MSLGEAFIEIHADLRPFARDLRRNVKPIVDAFEREINQAVSRNLGGQQTEQMGRRVGDRLSKGISRSLTEQFRNKNVFLVIAASLGSALDDGISALPTEVKAAIVLGIILAIPLISAYLTAALAASIGVGVAGLGVLLASQFEEVQEAVTEFGRNSRTILVTSARSFGDAIINSLATVEGRVRALQPLFTQIFDLSAPFLEPLVQGVLQGIQSFLVALRRSLGDIRPFMNELGAGIQIILRAVGRATEILARSGRDGQVALRDLARIIATLITATALFLTVFTKVYSVFRDLLVLTEKFSLGSSPLLSILGSFIMQTDNAANRAQSYANTNTNVTNSIYGVINATKKQNKEAELLTKGLESLSEGVKAQLDLNIAWEQSLDDIAIALKENGKTLDITTQKGRDNAREFRAALDVAEERTLKMLREGKLTNDQAISHYNQQIDALRKLAREAGISDQKFTELFGQIVETGKLRLSSESMGIDNLNAGLIEAASRANTLRSRMLAVLRATFSALSFLPGFSSALIPLYADGDIVNKPTLGVFGEAGPEVIIPLTKPARAAQLMHESGLDRMISGGPSQVMVFIGNEQLDARTVRIVERNNSAQALALAHGGRNF